MITQLDQISHEIEQDLHTMLGANLNIAIWCHLKSNLRVSILGPWEPQVIDNIYMRFHVPNQNDMVDTTILANCILIEQTLYRVIYPQRKFSHINI